MQAVNDPFFVWDYGTVVPLRYLTPSAKIPVVNLSVTLALVLKKRINLGNDCQSLKESDKRYVFIASGALSHNLVRGRHNLPTVSEHALDKEFVKLIQNKDYQGAYKMLPEYARMAKVESVDAISQCFWR